MRRRRSRWRSTAATSASATGLSARCTWASGPGRWPQVSCRDSWPPEPRWTCPFTWGRYRTEQAARTLEWQKVRFESAQSLSLKRGRSLSPEAEIALEDVTRLRDEVQRGRERLFHASLSVTLHARDEDSLKEMTQRAKAHFAATLGKLDNLAFRQREGLLSTLPLGLNAVATWRTLDTSSLARLFPFSPPDLDTRSGTLYGIDMRACSPVVYDPWDGTHLNANTAVLARSGSGKSFSTKLGVLRGLTRGVTAYVIDPEGGVRRHGPRGGRARPVARAYPARGMNPFVIDKGDSEELLQRIGSLRRLIEVMVGERLSAERRASLDHALAGYYAQPRERTGFKDFYKYLQEDEAGGADLARLLRPFATGSLRHLLSDEGDDLLGNEALVTVFDLRLLEPELRPAGRDGLHRDGLGRRRPGPQAPPPGRRRGVVDHAAPGGSGFPRLRRQEGAQTPARPPVHHPGRPGPPVRGYLAGHHRPFGKSPPSERRLQAPAPAGRGRRERRGRRIRPTGRPPALASVPAPGATDSCSPRETAFPSASRRRQRRRKSSSGGPAPTDATTTTHRYR